MKGGVALNKIAVIGAGGTGYTVAAELAFRGYETWLCDIFAAGEPIAVQQSKEINITGSVVETAVIHRITNNVKAVLENTQLVICCTISNRDEEVARTIAPHLMSGSKVLISAGNLGSLIYYRVFQELGIHDVIVGETCGNLFSCRRLDENTVLIGNPDPYKPRKAAAFPAKNTQILVDAFAGVYPLVSSVSILETALNGPNVLSHISLTVINAGAIENAEEPYYIFKQGICRSTLNLADALWAEKKQVMDALGFSCAPSPSNSHRKYADRSLKQFDHFRNLAGPDSMTSRYISEDIPILGCFFLSVAKAVGVETPVYSAMVRVTEAINQTPYYAQGRTLQNLGLAHLHGNQVPEYFRTAE